MNNSLTDFVIGILLLCVWIAYKGSLIEDIAAFLARILK